MWFLHAFAIAVKNLTDALPCFSHPVSAFYPTLRFLIAHPSVHSCSRHAAGLDACIQTR
jgi:hypothetical protein